MTDALSRLIDRSAPTATVTLAADPDDAPRIQAAEEAVKRWERAVSAAKTAEEAGKAEAERDDAADKLKALHDEIVTVAIALEGIGAPVVEELMVEHPPTKQQIQKALKDAGGNPKQRPQWNEDSFPVALLAQTIQSITFSDDPDGAVKGISEKDMGKLWKSKMTVADRSRLFVTALSLDQRGSSVDDLGKD